MECRAGDELSDEQLTAVIDETADGDVLQHLDRCPSCATRLEALQHFERQLTAHVARWDCPPPQQLADYHWGLAGRADAQQIAHHLEMCVRCTEEVETLRVFLNPDVTETQPGDQAVIPRSVRSRLRELVAVLVPSSPALAVRGEGRAPLVAEVDDMTIVLDVKQAKFDKVGVLGQVATDDPDRWTGALVEVRQNGKLQAIGEVDDMASFQCRSVPVGVSELSITSPDGMSIVLPEIELRHP